MVLAVPARAASPFIAEFVWGNGVPWVLAAPPASFPIPSNGMAQRELYEMAPQTATPQSTLGEHLGFQGASIAHDHTIPVPPGNHGEFSANWHVLVLLKNTGTCAGLVNPTAYFAAGPSGVSACLATNGVGGAPLTSVDNIEAAETAGMIVEFDTTVVFICPIQPAT